MALVDIRHEVNVALSQTHDAQRDARALLAHGGDEAKVVAAGELDFLEQQETQLRLRLIEIERRMAEHGGVFSWLRQAWFTLMLQFERWIAHG